VIAELDRSGGANGGGRRRFDLAGPETLTYDDIARVALRAWGRQRRLLHVPLPVVHAGLRSVEAVSRNKAFATWEEAELMEIPMTTTRGSADAESLGVQPLRMSAVLAGS
jgi:NADH dehydrogenase